jgi:hypothetical protein
LDLKIPGIPGELPNITSGAAPGFSGAGAVRLVESFGSFGSVLGPVVVFSIGGIPWHG